MSERSPQGDEADGARVLLLDLAAEPSALDDAHDALDQAWEEHPEVGDAERLRFVMAAMEILGNVVEHAYAADEEPRRRRLTLEVRRVDDGLLGTISDNGQPAALDLSDVTMPGEDAESGRGLALALAALDELGYERVEGRNVWTLRCAPRG
ncbi:ATP-binding protein [Nocardioides sp. ChNu-99]|uniref:ATP-binding protein n=1 Tax=Nocardioides sp. ChNu-99 TaxID=2839897 RepID=UPI002406C195|nr:ATP-binding protein [Nocardioides sp. ChNu-99]MDF9715398.1 ATP-binding protein [Nocardioides sp. ChNu-99]